MPEEPSESSSVESDAAVLGLDDTDLDPEPEVSEDMIPVESPSEEEEESEPESKEAASEEPAESKEAQEKPSEPEPKEEAEPVESETPSDSETAPFKFLDKEYKSVDDAEHAMKSYLGQVSAKEKQIEELTGLLKNINDRIEASESRKDEALAQPEGERKDAESKPSSFWDAFDFKTFTDEVENGGLEKGMEYMVYKVDEALKSMGDDIRQEMTGSIAPFQAWQEKQAEFNESFGYFADLAQRVDEEKNPIYPELAGDDREFAEGVATRWLNLFTPEERKRLGSYGAHIAYVLQKEEMGATAAGEPPPPPPPEPESKASEAFDRLNRQTNQGANEGVLTGSTTVKPPSKRTTQDMVNQELEEYGETFKEPILGI